MKDIVTFSIWLVFCLIMGVSGVITGYIDNDIVGLILGCLNIFLSGTLSMVLIVEIMFYRLRKKGEIK